MATSQHELKAARGLTGVFPLDATSRAVPIRIAATARPAAPGNQKYHPCYLPHSTLIELRGTT